MSFFIFSHLAYSLALLLIASNDARNENDIRNIIFFFEKSYFVNNFLSVNGTILCMTSNGKIKKINFWFVSISA